MRFIKTKKGAALAVTLVVVAASAIGAYAFLTTGGAGSGTATGGSTTNNLVIGTGTNAANPVSIGNGVTPGNSVAVSFVIYNPNSYAVHVASVSQSGAIANSNEYNAGSNPTGCQDGWFSFSSSAGGFTIPAGGTSATQTGSLAEIESGTNQDGCEGAILTLNVTSS
jgi:hypothetical protein